MSSIKHHERTRAQESSNAIEKMYITMLHLFNRGFYKPMGVSGETLRNSLLFLRPEIYGSIAEEKAELAGLLYVINRLPQGIEECRFINLTSDEGFKNAHFKPIIPLKRRRNCYRIDAEQMNIEITRGQSEIYDILTHLTFLFVESHKISKRVILDEGITNRDWKKLEQTVFYKAKLSTNEREVAISHVANILGRTFDEIVAIYNDFAIENQPERFLHIIYWLGKLAIEEQISSNKRTITFSPILREQIGHHVHAEIWATKIKDTLYKNDLIGRELHIISANMHSVMNTFFASCALQGVVSENDSYSLYESLGNNDNSHLRNKVNKHALENGMLYIKDTSGANIDVQIFDTSKLEIPKTNIKINKSLVEKKKPIILVMDYAFGEQAFETIDELLKPYNVNDKKIHLNVASISIMGKAGILEGKKGDIMIPSAHIFEGTADNYPFKNELNKEDLEGNGVAVYEGNMITVLGTSLQNKDILRFFKNSTWGVIGLEMEGAHYQKAIQAASKVRGNVSPNIKLRYAYYASDNPLESGATLASGGLGTTGVKPTYLITKTILEQILN